MYLLFFRDITFTLIVTDVQLIIVQVNPLEPIVVALAASSNNAIPTRVR